MTDRPMVTQGFYLQKETTPGDAVTSAMRRYLGLRVNPGWNVETQEFRAAGYKTNTVTQAVSESGQHTVETVQDFNALLPILASVLTYDGVTSAGTDAYEHTFSLNAKGEDDLTTFTGIYGDSAQALQLAYFVFNSLSIGIQRGSLTLDTSAISYEPETGATIPSTGVEEIKAVPLPARGYDVFIDDTWADLGTTQVRPYEGNLTIGDKRAPASPIDSSVTSFAMLLENEDIDFSGSIRPGFNPEALALQTAYKAGASKFLRFANVGPEIEAGVNYELEIDVSVKVQSPGEISAAPNAPVVTLPFNYLVMPDDVSGNTLTVRLVNDVPTL